MNGIFQLGSSSSSRRSSSSSSSSSGGSVGLGVKDLGSRLFLWAVDDAFQEDQAGVFGHRRSRFGGTVGGGFLWFLFG